MRRIFYFIIFIAVLVLAISFVVKNPADVEVVYYFNFKWNGSLSVLLFCVLAIGALLGTLLTTSWAWKAKRQRAGAMREMKRMEREISSLRALPAKE